MFYRFITSGICKENNLRNLVSFKPVFIKNFKHPEPYLVVIYSIGYIKHKEINLGIYEQLYMLSYNPRVFRVVVAKQRLVEKINIVIWKLATVNVHKFVNRVSS